MRTRAEKINFLKGLMNGTASMLDLAPAKTIGWTFINGVYKADNGGRQLTEDEFERMENEQQRRHENITNFVIVLEGEPRPSPGKIIIEL